MEEKNSEYALLGLLIKSPDLLDHCQLISNFENPFIGRFCNDVFRNIQKLYNTTGFVDYRELMKLGYPNIPVDFYQALTSSAGFNVQLNEYINDIYSAFIKRKLTGLGATLVNCHEDEINTGEDYLNKARNLVNDLDASSCVTTGVTIEEAIKEVIDKVQSINSDDGSHYMKTGILALDGIIIGLTTKTTSIWAARPSVGKTAAAITAMSNMMLNGIACGFVSVEMSEAQIVERIAQVRSGVNSEETHLSKSNFERFFGELTALKDDRNIQVQRTTNRKISNIRSMIRKMKNTNPNLSIVFIDYIQKVQGDDRNQDMRLQIAEISSSLTDIATDLNIHVAALAQIGREGDDAPKLKHLKESGRLEEDAHYAFLIHRDLNKQHMGEDDGDAFIGVAKNRGGRTGNAQIKYNGKTTRFYDQEAREF